MVTLISVSKKTRFLDMVHHLRYDNVENFHNIIFQGVLCKCFVFVIHEKGMQVNRKYSLKCINRSKLCCYLHLELSVLHCEGRRLKSLTWLKQGAQVEQGAPVDQGAPVERRAPVERGA